MIGLTRRRLILAAAACVAWVRLGVAALLPTPRATEGPFYPIRIPDEPDNDLVRVGTAANEAKGDILYLGGRVLDTAGQPVFGAIVEIWQCDANGVYLHPRDPRREMRDEAFQGFGRATTDADGRFEFRTILPVPYSGRTPHIHAKVVRDGRDVLTTQFYRAGYPDNARDFLFRRMTPAEQERVSMTMERRPSSGREAWATEISIVV